MIRPTAPWMLAMLLALGAGAACDGTSDDDSSEAADDDDTGPGDDDEVSADGTEFGEAGCGCGLAGAPAACTTPALLLGFLWFRRRGA